MTPDEPGCTADQLAFAFDDRKAWQPLPVPPDLSGQGWYVGTSGYSFEDWVGRFNPPRASGEARDDQDRLRFYQNYFSFVEINQTFYREPSAEAFAEVERRSKASMRYSVKVHQDISHTRQWDARAGKERMRRHIAAAAPLVETGRFYSFLIQLEDHVCRDQRRIDYLLAVASEAIRRGLDVHVEFRHNSWHGVHPLQSLMDNGVGICNTEIPPVPHAFPLKAYATTDKGYIRYSGRNLQNWYPKERQATWRDRIAARDARYDYLYSKAEVEERTRGQMALRRKVSQIALAYNNHYRAQAALNAIQNLRRVKQALDAERG